MGAATAPAGARSSTQAALDAPAPPALCASGEDRAAPASRQRDAPRGVWLLEAVYHILAPHGWHINTAFVERINLSIRQHVAAVGRQISTLCKGEDGLRQQLALYHVYYNFCLPHVSLRQALPHPAQTHGSGSATQWRPCTPAMAAGLTERVWSLREVLLYRVPPWPQPQAL